MNWYRAFLKQAASDYSIYEYFEESKEDACHRLHYLQMATEKIAKAYLWESAGNVAPPEASHYVLVKALRVMRKSPTLKRALKFNDTKSYVHFLKSLEPFAKDIQDLVPVGQNSNQPNPEYPWLRQNTIVPPVDYDFHTIYTQREKLARLRRLIKALIEMEGKIDTTSLKST